MNFKINIKSFIAGFAACTILGGTIAAYGQNISKSIDVVYSNIKVIVDGVEKTPSQEPFVYNGSTFVPLRFISESLGKKVTWDSNNKKVYIGDTTGNAAKQIPLYNKPMSNSQGKVSVDNDNKSISLEINSFGENGKIKDDQGNYHCITYIEYNLNEKSTTLLGKFGVEETHNPEASCILKAYDQNGNILYKSDIMKQGMDYLDLKIDVKNANKIKLEIDSKVDINSLQIVKPVFKDLSLVTAD